MVGMGLAPTQRAKQAALGAAVRSTGLPRAVGLEMLAALLTLEDRPEGSQPDGCLSRTSCSHAFAVLGVLNDSGICQEWGSAPDRVTFLGCVRKKRISHDGSLSTHQGPSQHRVRRRKDVVQC